jgi:hypothetical protein
MKRIIYSILFFLLVTILVVLTKPSLMFESNGGIKAFGIGEDKTMFSFGVFTVVISIASFYIFCVIDMIFES